MHGSHRPALEERHARMEKARQQWRERLQEREDEGGLEEPSNSEAEECPQSSATHDGGELSPTTRDTDVVPAPLGAQSETLPQQPSSKRSRGVLASFRGGTAPSPSTARLGARPSGESIQPPHPRPASTPSRLSPIALARNLDLGGAFDVDTSDIVKSTYDLDHEFEDLDLFDRR